MTNTTMTLVKPKKNTLTSQNQTYHNIVNYSYKPFGYQLINYENLLEINGKKFEPFKFTATDDKEYQVKSYIESPWQRDTNARVATNTGANGHYNDLNVMARYVDCTLYIGEKTKVEGEHEIEPNTLVFNDAHARLLASKLHIGRNPINPNCTVNVPQDWVLLITVTGDIDDLQTNYDCNDSRKASKSRRHEVQSVLRALNYLPFLKSDFIRQGTFASSIDQAVPVKKSSPKALQNLELLDQIKMIKEPLELLDKKFAAVTRPDPDKPNVLQQHQILGIMMMFAQQTAFGNDPRLMTAIERLIKNDEDKTGVKQDGIFVLCNLFDGNGQMYQTLSSQIGGLYTAFKPYLNSKPNNASKLLLLAQGMTYYDRTEGPNLVVYLINHYLQTNGGAVDISAINWKRDIHNKYKNLVHYVYNGGTEI